MIFILRMYIFQSHFNVYPFLIYESQFHLTFLIIPSITIKINLKILIYIFCSHKYQLGNILNAVYNFSVVQVCRQTYIVFCLLLFNNIKI